MIWSTSVNFFEEAIKYYANILTPFSALVTNKIKELLSFNLPVDMICPSHGIVWRDNPKQIIEKYMEWADKYNENQITLVYDSMWKSTRKMAEAIAEGIKSVDSDVAVKLFSASHADKNDILTELFRSKAFMVGSSTINKMYCLLFQECWTWSRGSASRIRRQPRSDPMAGAENI
jgi:Uncharacterized flavoproteins